MFCYCPLYFIECPVNVPLLSNGLKDCMECTATHRGKKAWVIVRKYLDKHWEKCSEITQIYFVFNLFSTGSHLCGLSSLCSYVARSTKERVARMRVSLVRKLWKEKVQIPVLQKQVDETLRQIDVKLNNRGVKVMNGYKNYINMVLKNRSLTVFLAVVVVAMFFGWIGG